MRKPRPIDRRSDRFTAYRAAFVESLEGRTLLAFGVTTSTAATGQPTYVIDNGGDVKFAVIRGGNVTSTIHLGDVTSIQYKGQEILAPYATTSRYSHYEQGLGSTAAITYTIGGNNSWIVVAADDSAAASGGVIQYYAVRKGDSNIYMASLPTDVTNGPGEGRFIAYLSKSVFPNPEAPSDNSNSTGAIEGSDVFGRADGTTSSKFYNMGRRMIENEVHGLTGTAGATAVGAYMFMGNREHSAGGPFFKDIDFQTGSAIEIYNCIFTGHTQTETYRQGLHTYALQLNGGTAPTTPDYSWLEAAKDPGGVLLIRGLVPAAQRGGIAGNATGVVAGHETVVTLSNATEQYWDMADASGNYAIAGVMPGTYTQTIYDNELAVGTKTVTIAAGVTTNSNIVNASPVPAATWRIGTWDGTPLGFLNADKIEVMHPSDVRMSSWTSTQNFVIGTNTDAQFTMAQFMGVNNARRITFTLTSAQAAVAQTLRIGITLGFEGARPRITVNAGQTGAYTSAIPSASRDLNSRGITRGTWRGDNQLYTFNLPTTSLKAGTNTIDIPLVSGSYAAGQTWLSPNVVFDAIDLVPTSLATPRAIASVAVTPANATLATNGTKAYVAVAKDSSGNVLAANFNWSATGGSIDANGNYVAPATAGTQTITALATTTRTAGYATNSASSTSAFGASTTGTGTTGVTVIAPPAAPTNLTATAGNAQVALAWTAAGGATSYSIKRATVSGGPYTTIAAGLTGTNYTDATAANGTTYYYVVTAVNAVGSTDSVQTSATPAAPLAPAPTVTSFVVNDGAAQRSMVRSLTVNFSKLVTLGTDAISLTRAGTVVSFTLSPAGGSNSQYVLTFAGSGIVGGSLGDGDYLLKVNAAGVAAAGSAAMAADASTTFHRYFGDVDGDRDVDATDSRAFRAALDAASTQSTYRYYFDFDGDGDIDATDSRAFRGRLDTILP